MSQKLAVQNGEIALPKEVIGRYRLDDDTPVKIIETRNGILLIPLTDDPMSESLRAEIEAWQALGIESLGCFLTMNDPRIAILNSAV